jgi:hypothetical protein
MPVMKFPDEMEWENTLRGYYLSEVKEKVLRLERIYDKANIKVLS